MASKQSKSLTTFNKQEIASRSAFDFMHSVPTPILLIHWLMTIDHHLYVHKDDHCQICNGFGCGLGEMQLILHAIYCNNKGELMNNNDSMEMMGEIEEAANVTRRSI